MKSFALASGSSGNCFYIESTNEKILIDCGLSLQKTTDILEEKKIKLSEITAIFVTHEHSDHILGLDSFLKKTKIPIFMSQGTKNALKIEDKKIKQIKHHEVINLKSMKIFALEKNHDAREPLSFVVESKGKKIGVFTDVGSTNSELHHIISTLDVVYFEINYCDSFIKELKDLPSKYINRLISNKGHLSINQAIECLQHFKGKSLILCHISENTNSYEHVFSSLLEFFSSLEKSFHILVSFQSEATEWVEC